MAERWIAITDTHGDQIDAEAWGFVRDFIAEFKPSRRLHLGDVFDFRWLRKGATDEERAEDIAADIDSGLNLLDEYKPTEFLFGNHDNRLIRAAKDATGVVRASARDIHDQVMRLCSLHDTKVYPYSVRKGVAEVGHIKAIHGYRHGLYASRQHAQTWGNVIAGHVHRVDAICSDRVTPDGTCAVGRSIGCLCRLDMEYAQYRTATLTWAHGFVFGEIKNGRASICQATRDQVTGEWSLPIYSGLLNDSKHTSRKSSSPRKRKSGSRSSTARKR
ncbi:MAG: hypothetical protein MJH10_12315 [Epibacterium sp.]|nr:hypothetical protein [Epibacterium sp.]NQX74333.1 hypothetical protein [Epibacterium sp.]